MQTIDSITIPLNEYRKLLARNTELQDEVIRLRSVLLDLASGLTEAQLTLEKMAVHHQMPSGWPEMPRLKTIDTQLAPAPKL